jgi:membrane-associated phospholipid phosphatase
MSAVRSLGVLLASAVLVAGLAPGASGQEVQADETGPGTTVLVPGWFDQQPAPPEPTPRHTGIHEMFKQLGQDFKYLPAKENAYWAAFGGGLALAVHPADDNVNAYFLDASSGVKNFFKPGAVLGQSYVLFPVAATIYIIGRAGDRPHVSHTGMDLIRALIVSEAMVQTLKYTTRRERPDGSGKTSFPSGHAADTFAFATALERHLNWKLFVPAYAFSSYVAMSRLPANRHWLSDVVMGSAVGIISGRTVTGHELMKYNVQLVPVPGGIAVSYVHATK